MKYSFSLGQYHSKKDLSKILSLSQSDFAEKLNSQIGAFDEIIDWGARYEGVYVVEIVKVEKHPDADKLQICFINDGGVAKNVERGSDGLIQLVCGGPNAREGLFTAWVSPGAIVPSTYDDKEPFVLSKIKLRGIESSGMLATPKELAISNDHDVVIELQALGVETKLTEPGTPFKKLFGLDDVIVDFENKMFTHRPDCFGHLGIAREIAGIQGINFESPGWYDLNVKPPKAESKLKLEVKNQVPELVPRYTAVCIEGLRIEPSPMWLKAYLTRLGIKPINNVVDITNYMMILTGQPIHAFDFDKVGQNDKLAKLTIRHPSTDDKIKTLKVISGKELELHESTITIYKDDTPIDLAGINGGANSEISGSTTKIILQSAIFDMYSIRRTSMRFGIFTDAVTRYTKGQSEEQTWPVLIKAMQMLQELIPEVKFGKIIDINSKDSEFEHQHLVVPIEKINRVLGLNLSHQEISNLLSSVEIENHDMGNLNEICATVPFWRKDLQIEEDLIEEIGRLYGFNKIEAKLPIRPATPARKNTMIELKKAVRSTLSRLGANEVLTYNFVNTKLLEHAGQNPEMAFKIRNALSPDLQVYRLSLIPNLLEKIHPNIKAGEPEFVLYEIGKAHIKEHLESEAGLPEEFQRLSLIYANKTKTDGAPFYIVKRYLIELLDSLNLSYKFTVLNEDFFSAKVPITSVYEPARSAGIEIEGELRGIIGEFNSGVTKNFKLPESSAGFEIDLEWCADKFSQDPVYEPLSKFPSVNQDVTISISSESSYAEAKSELQDKLEKVTKKSGIKFSVSLVSIFQKEGSNSKNITFSLEFWHLERTLKTEDTVNLLSGSIGVG
jgi:phenylalanyl-tRNA synthetase beta chain